MHDLIEVHRAWPDNPSLTRALADALERVGPVLTDDGEIYVRTAEGQVRSFTLSTIRSARSVPAPLRLGDQGE
jgi:hypothetical protein